MSASEPDIRPAADADLPEPEERRPGLARLVSLVTSLPSFGKLLYRLLGDRRVSLVDRALFGATLVYLVVPVDLVPDWIPGLGQLDDLLLVLVALDRLLYRTDPAVLLEHWDGDPEVLLDLRGALDRSVDALPGWVKGLLRAG